MRGIYINKKCLHIHQMENSCNFTADNFCLLFVIIHKADFDEGNNTHWFTNTFQIYIFFCFVMYTIVYTLLHDSPYITTQ